MRARIFFIIAAVIYLVTLATAAVHYHVVEREFVAGVDRQIRALAISLIGADLSELKLRDIRRAEGLLSEELGTAKSGKFFIIRDAQGRVLMKNQTVDLENLESIPYDRQYVTVERRNRFMRVLSLDVPHLEGRILQVGVVMDRESTPLFVSWEGIFQIAFSILALGSIASWLLTIFLLKPVRDLGLFLATASASADKRTLLPFVPDKIYKSVTRSDEFFKMVTDLNSLIHKINDNYLMHRQWTSQMAHELKTPLSLLNLRLENIFLHKTFSEDDKYLLEADMKKITSTINSFLDWAEIEYSENKREVFACRIQRTVNAVLEPLPAEAQARTRKNIESDDTFFCHSQHLEQLISNLVTNALKYSDPGTPVDINYVSKVLSVINRGPGFPEDVLARLGEPFNKGSNSKKSGHGLGLAWVKSICKVNGWQFEVARGPNDETICRVRFGGITEPAVQES